MYKRQVRNFTNFGVFVEIEEGVDGLQHKCRHISYHIFSSFIPVSYTHLDVYKRQASTTLGDIDALAALKEQLEGKK